jgi:hypothetical protein
VSTETRSFPRLQPELDEAADGFGAAGRVVLLACPGINLCEEFIGKPNSSGWISPRCGATRASAFTSDRFWYCLFHNPVLPYSGLKNKRPAAVLKHPDEPNPDH